MLRLGDDLKLPDDAATDANAILAKRGAGKSNTAVVMAEEMHGRGIPWVAIDPKGDWWGVRADGEEAGLPVPVLGGLRGDVPLEPGAGKMVADLIASENLTCVLDVSEFDTKGDQLRFLADFADRLYRRHGKSQDVRHLFLEEADEYIPQRESKSSAVCRHRWSRIATKGRQRGLGITLVTQRSAIVDKDVLTQTDTLIAMRVTAPQDRKAIEGWVDYHDVGREVVDSLPTLQDGEAWVCSPQRLGEPRRVQIRRRRTFDSGATPTGRRRRRPAEMGDVDLEALREQMTEAVEKAEADDPDRLRKTIRELEAEVRDLRAAPARVETVVEVREVVPEEVMSLIESIAEETEAAATGLGGTAARLERLAAWKAEENLPPPVRTREPPDRAEAPQERLLPPPERGLDGDGPTLKQGARRMAAALAEAWPLILTRPQVAALAGNKSVKSSTFRTYWSQITRGGLVEEVAGGFRASRKGLAYCGVNGSRADPEAVRDRLRGALKQGARDMLDAVDKWGVISKEQLAREAGMSERQSSTFRTYLSTLSRNGLVVVDGDDVRPVELAS